MRGCLYCSIPNSLCISLFFPLWIWPFAGFFFSIAAFHSLSLFSTPLCCIYYPTLLPPPISSVICAPPEIRGFSTLATLVWGSSKTLPSSSPHIQLTHLISLGFFHFHHRVVISSRAFVTSDSELRLTLRVTVNLSIPDNLLHSSSTHPLPVV